jgi:hypothetical protein
MKSMKRILCCCLLGQVLYVQAQQSDATRYRNAQGIEVIQNRGAQVREEPRSPPAASAAAASQPKTVAQEAAFQISAKEQAERDRDRKAILQDELAKEMEAYQTKMRMLQANAVQASLPDDQVVRLKEMAVAHEKNIHALHAELGRIGRTH